VPIWQKTRKSSTPSGCRRPIGPLPGRRSGAGALLLDNPKAVVGLRVARSRIRLRLVAIRAAKAGAIVAAADIDASRSCDLAQHGGERRPMPTFWCATCSRSPPVAPRYDVILVGDLFYELTPRRVRWPFWNGTPRRHARAGRDPGRTYLPKERLARLAEYSVPVTRELEDLEIKRTGVGALALPPHSREKEVRTARGS